MTEVKYYIAIGASAGGLEAIEQFFINMTEVIDCAFIVIQHLSPDYKSLMVEILSKKTRMPVHRAEDGMDVLANNVYLIPPKKNLSIFHGKLVLTEQDHTRGINLPIDYFFKSLAEDQKEKSIGIVLSGTGSDGSRGIKTIKEYGGLAIVQSEESAKFNGMPRAAISTGLIDFITSPEEMPKQLISFKNFPMIIKPSSPEIELSDEDSLFKIFSLLRDRTKVDFGYYKQSTIIRRIQRRMIINQCERLTDYASFMQINPIEIQSLFRELLIGVTSFFRDSIVFEKIKNVLSSLLKESSSKEMRFWVAGCSTGEEAYSLAILTKECLEENFLDLDIKIFATDIDSEAVKYAANGIYSDSIAADIPQNYLNKYFSKKDDKYQINRNIREMIVFAQHNLTKDPPFTNISFLSCRNLLIYFQSILQKKVFDYFNFSLIEDGILLLGTSETPGEAEEYFETIDQKSKIYKSKGKTKLLDITHSQSTDTRMSDAKESFVKMKSKFNDNEKILEMFIEILSPEIIPFCFIVNKQLEVLNLYGDSKDFFRLSPGKVTNDLNKLLVKEIKIPVSTGIQKCLKSKKEVKMMNISMERNGKTSTVNLLVKALPQKKGLDSFIAVIIQDIKRKEDACNDLAIYDISAEADQKIKDLEQELQFSKENLQATVEELETSNEELQATNEELLASNEELQSTNEELQSSNEELFTVNAEYHNKIIELTELNNDINNMMTSIKIGVLLLDDNLEIRKFSNPIIEFFNVFEYDVGKSISLIQNNLKNIDIVKIVKNVQITGEIYSDEIISKNNKIFSMKVFPYMIGENIYSGTVITFADISDLKSIEKDLKISNDRIEKSMESGNLAWWEMSYPDGSLVAHKNKALMLGYNPKDFSHYKDFMALVHPDDVDITMKNMKDHLDGIEKKYISEYRIKDSNGEYHWFRDVGGITERNSDGSPSKITGIVLDITNVKKIQDELILSERKLNIIANISPALFWMSGLDKQCYWFNDTWLNFTGRTLEQEKGNGWLENVHPEDIDRCMNTYIAAFDKREKFSMRYRMKRHDGEYRMIIDEGKPMYNNKEFIGYIGSCLDVQEEE